MFPDNASAGNLESLLLAIVNPANAAANNCFDAYINCIQALGAAYNTPDNKTKVFAYLNAIGKESKEKKRDYTDADAWNLDHASMQRFIQDLHDLLDY